MHCVVNEFNTSPACNANLFQNKALSACRLLCLKLQITCLAATLRSWWVATFSILLHAQVYQLLIYDFPACFQACDGGQVVQKAQVFVSKPSNTALGRRLKAAHDCLNDEAV